MAETPLEKLVEEILAAILSRGKGKITSFYEKGKSKKALKEAVRDFLDDFQKNNLPYLSLYEEFDFGGFRGFLLSRLDLLEGYFYAKADEREAILKALRGEALVCAKPRGAGGTQVVLKCLNAVLATMDSILMEKLDTEDLMLAYRIEEQYRQNSKALAKELEEHIYGYIQYKESFAELVDSVNTEPPDDGRAYHYKNSRIGFYGREKELRYLDAFLENNAQFLYTVITGPGGIGKSKLLYHYVRVKRNDDSWKMLFPSRDIVKELCSHHREFFYPKNLLIVVDYAGQYPEKIGNWMGKILGTRGNSQKIRLVLLERPNPERNAKPGWYKKMVERRKELENYLWNQQFHEIGLMDRDALMALMDDIAEQAHKTLTDQNRQDIYERVCSFRNKEKDETSSPTNEAGSSHEKEQGGSPLYTILTTDSFLNGLSLPSLDSNKLIKYVLDRDREYWKFIICGDNDNLYGSFTEMLVYATATGGWDFTDLGKPLIKDAELLQEISNRGKTAVWEKFSQTVQENDEGNLVLKPLEPDLIGEYFVLSFLQDQMANKRYQGRIRLFWDKPVYYTYFLARCVDSYLSQQEFQELLYGKKTVFWLSDGNEQAAYLSAGLMVNLTVAQDVIAGAESVEQLRKLSQEEYVGNEEIALAYAVGLFNLSNEQDLSGCKASVERLAELSGQYAENEKIALEYALGLVNLIAEQDSIAGAESVKQLRVLSQEKFVRNENIALEYAEGLFNLSHEQDLSGRKASVERLGDLSGRYVENEGIALVYAQGLYNLSNEQDLSGRKASVERLRELAGQYVENEEIALEYANGLFNLSNEQNLSGRKASVERLEKLSHQYTENEVIALVYAQGLFNLSNEQDLSGIKASVERLGELSRQHAENEEIALEYAKGLVNLGNKQDLSGIKVSVECLGELSHQYTENETIALLYAEDLAWLCAKERSEEIVIQECQTFYTSWQADPEAIRQSVSAEPDSNMKTLKLFLLEHTELFPEFMEWLVA